MVAGLLLSGCTRQSGRTEALDEGWSMLVAEDYASAQAHYQSMLAEDPNNAVANLNLGVAYEELGDNAKAAKHYQIAIANGKFVAIREVVEDGKAKPRQSTVAKIAVENLTNLGLNGGRRRIRP
jgi:tetratricopeptide (TPR) repeat protein